MRTYEIDPDDRRLVRLTDVEPLLMPRPFELYDYTIPDLTKRTVQSLSKSSGTANPMYTGRNGVSGEQRSVDERYLEPFKAAQRISGLYSHFLDPLRFSGNIGTVPERADIFQGFARTVISPRILPLVELVAEQIGELRDLDAYQIGIGTNAARWMQYLAYEAWGSNLVQRGFTLGGELERLRAALRVIRDSATVLDRYHALARRC